jgi:hypothetical protein
LDYEPKNEAGVIILFTLTMKRLGFSGIIEAKKKFPDCIARKHANSVPIEFEYKSKHFVTHGHLEELGKKKCTIVCWEDNWQNPPKNISIISLSRELGLASRVRLTHAQHKDDIRFLDQTRRKRFPWSMPAGTKKGDLLLVWRSGSKQSKFYDILEALGNATPKHGYAGWANCRVVCHLRNPVTLQDIRNHNVLGRSAMVKTAFFMGSNKELTPYWTWLYQLVVDRNPEVQRVLRDFAPGVFTI